MICRLCLSCEGAMNSIVDARLQLCDKIHSISSVRICLDDGLPGTICMNCTEKVESFYDFKNIMECSNNTLKQWVKENFPEIPEEPKKSETEPVMHDEQLEVAPRIVQVDKEQTDIDRYVCLLCNTEFPEKGEILLSHAKGHFSSRGKFQNKPNFECELCLELFKERSAFVKHQRIHFQIKPFKCKRCSREFGTENLLREHWDKNNDCQNINLLSCHYCGSLFKLETDLTTHEDVHLNSIMYKCNLCDKRLLNRNTYRLHLNYHKIGKTFICSICDKSYFTSSQLKKHSLIHRTEKPFSCTLCDKTFTTKSQLSRHMPYHYKTKTYKCRYCWTAFYENHHLKEHIKLKHENIKKFTCELCGKMFASENGLKKHLKNPPTLSPYTSNQEELENGDNFHEDSRTLCETNVFSESAISTDQEIILVTELDNSDLNLDLFKDDTSSSGGELDPSIFVIQN